MHHELQTHRTAILAVLQCSKLLYPRVMLRALFFYFTPKRQDDQKSVSLRISRPWLVKIMHRA